MLNNKNVLKRGAAFITSALLAGTLIGCSEYNEYENEDDYEFPRLKEAYLEEQSAKEKADSLNDNSDNSNAYYYNNSNGIDYYDNGVYHGDYLFDDYYVDEETERKNEFDEKIYNFIVNDYVKCHSISDSKEYVTTYLSKFEEDSYESKKLNELLYMLSDELYSCVLKSLENYYSLDRLSLTDEEIAYADSVSLYLKKYIDAYESDDAFGVYSSACDISNNIDFDFFLNYDVYKAKKNGDYKPENYYNVTYRR